MVSGLSPSVSPGKLLEIWGASHQPTELEIHQSVLASLPGDLDTHNMIWESLTLNSSSPWTQIHGD